MQLCQVRVPIGVLALLFEDPMMLLRSAAMLLKTGNAALLHHLRSEVPLTEAILMTILREVLETHGVPVDAAQLLCDDYRSTTRYLLDAHGEVDLVIPILSRPIAPQLRAESTVPIADIGAGNCHVYIDAAADMTLAIDVVLDSKIPFTTLPRAAEQVLVHVDIAEAFIPRLTDALAAHEIHMHVDDKTAHYAPAASMADSSSWRSGYGTLDLGCAVVDSVTDAVAHINRYGSGHTEAVVTSDVGVAHRFSAGVDAGMVTVNAATTFAHANANPMDPELAFSTYRLAPRGPLKLREFTTTKWLAWPVELELTAIAEVHEASDTDPVPVPFGDRFAFERSAPTIPFERPVVEQPQGARSASDAAEMRSSACDGLDYPLIPTQRGSGAHAAPEPDEPNQLRT
jgi:glutamate-5-semialdehyde dehydrogenase